MKIGICRVIGNELPPRDRAGGKLKSLNHILEREEGVDRYWILNHLHDKQYRDTVINLLFQKGERFEEITFDASHYGSLSTFRERLCYAININQARNQGIRLTTITNNFCACLDQDCFFTANSWQSILQAINNDQQLCPERYYYGLIMKRVIDLNRFAAEDLPNQEPQLVFRKDAPRLFDPDIPFGEGDKSMLLSALGYGPGPDFAITGDRCRTVGFVFHAPAGAIASEIDFSIRSKFRAESVRRLIHRLDTIAH